MTTAAHEFFYKRNVTVRRVVRAAKYLLNKKNHTIQRHIGEIRSFAYFL